MRVVLDTNVIISGAYWSGLPADLLDRAIAKQFLVAISRELLDELSDVYSRPKFAKRVMRLDSSSERSLIDIIQDRFELVVAAPTVRIVPNDPDDDAVIACAVAARADYIISGDTHLLSLGEYQGIPIFSVEQFVGEVLPPLLKENDSSSRE